MATAGHHQVAIADRALGQPRHHRDAVAENQFERAADLQLLNVFGQVPARHALVHMLVAGQRVELFDARLDVVAQHPLALGDRGEIDIGDHPLVIVDDAVRNVDTQLGLRPQHREPQSALADDLGLRRPDRDHLVAGIPAGQHVWNRHKYTAYGGG